ncbi:PAS domain-containing protein [Halodesulfovibrio marinisediminis]|uniref:PAS domain-containing protein n=1 Tax=Halodesulfovibrio marinisediminis TaxID=458711 RepID=UPI001FE45F14|nr:transporter substrate-binding domain-containing protein [Halodesulfovibrio marinisediminis]
MLFLLLPLCATLPVYWYFYENTRLTDPLSEMEREWLGRLDRPLVLAVTPDTRPLEFVDAQGEYQGMVADYVHRVAEELNIEFEVVEPANMQELLWLAKQRRVDVIAAFAGNPASTDAMLFTNPYLELSTAILANRSGKEPLSLSVISEKKMGLALPKGYDVLSYVEKFYPDIHIQTTYNYLAALLHVSFNEIDATIISLPQASYFIEDKGITNLRVAGYTDYRLYYRMGVRSDMPILADIFQKALDNITPVERERILKRWVHLQQDYLSAFFSNRFIWYIIVSIVSFTLLAFVGIIFWNRTLRLRVNERTRELKRELKDRTRFLAALDQAEDGIFILDTDGILEYVNASLLNLTQYTEEEMLGRHISMLRAKQHPQEFFEELWKVLRSGGVWRGETVYVKKNGEEISAEVTATPVFDETGALINIVELIRDVTEQRKMEEHLKQSQKLEELGTLAGGIAHDFNNIIAAISGYAELALPSTEKGSRAHTNLERIQQVAERARAMVHQILVFSRRRKPEKVLVDVSAMVKEVLQLLRPSLPSTIEIKSKLADGCTVMADASQLHQVVMNLGTNAGYAMRTNGGILTISISSIQLLAGTARLMGLSRGRYVSLVVEDTGEGIPAHHVRRIFDPFFTTKPKGEGTGMGLSMVHGIITSMRGHISVESSEGVGTRFTVLIPYSKGEEEGEIPTAVPLTEGEGSIMLVDDEEDLVKVYSAALEDLGYDVRPYNDSAEALGAFRDNPYSIDLLITDQTMPKLTGDKLATAVHIIRPDLPIILCSGYSDAIDSIKEGQNGIRKVLLKPFELQDLGRAVQELLRRKL